jgi:hypothetical protein
MRQNPPADRGRLAGQLLTLAGALILGVDAVLSIPPLTIVIRDPGSHQAEDAGMTAAFLLIPMAIAGIACLFVAYLLWKTRAGVAALVTASLVVFLVVLNMNGIPLIVPATMVSVGGLMLVAWFAYRDWIGGSIF